MKGDSMNKDQIMIEAYKTALLKTMHSDFVFSAAGAITLFVAEKPYVLGVGMGVFLLGAYAGIDVFNKAVALAQNRELSTPKLKSLEGKLDHYRP